MIRGFGKLIRVLGDGRGRLEATVHYELNYHPRGAAEQVITGTIATIPGEANPEGRLWSWFEQEGQFALELEDSTFLGIAFKDGQGAIRGAATPTYFLHELDEPPAP